MLFSAFWEMEYIPENCRTARIIALFKGGKRDSSIPTNYRPISISDALAKLYDAILTHRLKHLLTHVLVDCQYGGRKGLGCNLQLIRVDEYLLNTVYRLISGCHEGLNKSNKRKRGEGGRGDRVGKPTLQEIKRVQVNCIYKCTCRPTVKLLAHKGMLNEDFSRSFQTRMNQKVTQCWV